MGAALCVKEGRAKYMRDGVLFNDNEVDVALGAALELAAKMEDGELRVLDFGGAFGDVYWRHKIWLMRFKTVTWDVVEQPAFVSAGRTHFNDIGIKYFYDVNEAEDVEQHNVLLCSGTLQYMEEPLTEFAKWESLAFKNIILANLPLLSTDSDIITTQHVPSSIYRASYPVRFFSRASFLARVTQRYTLQVEFPSEAVWIFKRKKFESTGLLLRLKSDFDTI